MNRKILQSVLSGKKDNNIKFKELQTLLLQLGLKERIKGDHFIYIKHNTGEIINIQPVGNMAKGYQVKQVRDFILKHRLAR